MHMIKLKCVKEGSKLRVKIISPGYNSRANCQFPKNIRSDGAIYEVPAEDVGFSENAQNKFFYRIKKNNIKIITDQIDQIFEDESTTECVICMTEEKDVVFAPCGHYCCCNACATKLNSKCPICRGRISTIVKYDQIAI